MLINAAKVGGRRTRKACSRLRLSARKIAVACALAASSRAGIVQASEPGVVADDRDEYTLLYRHPVNRQLFEQIAAPEYAYRLGPRSGSVTALSDVAIGTQQTLGSSSQSRYHGWFLADTYLAARPVNGIDVNLNLLLLNPSASDGYRLSGSVHPGLALHLYRNLFELEHHPVRFDLIGLDLGWVTTGNGLLLESLPLEGVLGVVRWKDFELDYLFAGRAYWTDDDYETLSLSALKRKVQINLVNWQKHDPPLGSLPPLSSDSDDTHSLWSNPMGHAYYATLATRWPITPWLRLATEFGCRLEQRPRIGALNRADVILRDSADYALHFGYQFRFYQVGFGPRDRLIAPTWVLNSPLQQDSYVTNPFEYLGLSPAYDQWSHTVMGEGRARLGYGLEVFANSELLVRYARASTVPKLATYTADGFRAPGKSTQLYYETGLRYYPWPTLPHRFSLSATNKQVQAAGVVTDPVERRFAPGHFCVLMGEVYL
jgi:hypothetical protein